MCNGHVFVNLDVYMWYTCTYRNSRKLKNFRLTRNDEIFYAKIFLLVILYTVNKRKYCYTKISNTKALQTKLMQITVSGMEHVDITC